MQLPIIDISPYLPSTSALHSDEERRATASSLHLACRDIGFLYLNVKDYIPKSEMDEILSLGKEFFQRPQDEKDIIRLSNSDGVRGYQRLHENVTQGKADHHEGLDLYAPSPYPLDTPLKPLSGENQWPTIPSLLRPRLEAWIEKMKVLGMAVMRGMCDGLGVTEEEWREMSGMVDDTFWVMRVIGYPPLPDGAEGVSCGSHKDYGCLTFLLADPYPSALQVLSTTQEWINADPLPGCLVVNIGQMWEFWTGGLYPATLHRVVHRSPTYRVSIPFFFEPNFDARVKVLEAAKRRARTEGREITEGKEVVYGDFLVGKVSGNFKY
ncbi:hypothetical protein P7C73_g4748, partial [Tremellales sp. Uapishka_1]